MAESGDESLKDIYKRDRKEYYDIMNNILRFGYYIQTSVTAIKVEGGYRLEGVLWYTCKEDHEIRKIVING